MSAFDEARQPPNTERNQVRAGNLPPLRNTSGLILRLGMQRNVHFRMFSQSAWLPASPGTCDLSKGFQPYDAHYVCTGPPQIGQQLACSPWRAYLH